MGFSLHVILARELFPESLPGDEPEPMEVEQYPFEEADDLVSSVLISESRSIAEIKIAEVFLSRESKNSRV